MNDKSVVFQHIFNKCNVKANQDLWSRKIRPTLSKKIHTPLHARHMEPSCDGAKGSEVQLALFVSAFSVHTNARWSRLT